ncbi:MAG: hypothetical protein HY868_26125 [Chloroflexi bacterium]|nr:hypothetical protein [Chloroflexota bacterium]
MNKWLKIGTFATVVALIALMSVGTGAAFAQGPTTTMPALGRTLGLYGGGLGGPENSLVAVAAKAFGMDLNALIAELNTGKTIADVAQAKGVALAKIVDEFVALRAQSLQAAVDAKRITQAQADAALAQIKTQVQTDLTSPHAHPGIGSGLGNNRTNPSMGQFPGARGRWAR